MVYLTAHYLGPYVNIKILAGECGDLVVLLLPKASIVSKFLHLLYMPPDNLEWSSFFFGLSLPSVCGGQFMNQ